MEKVRSGILITATLLMGFISACSPAAEPPADKAVIPSIEINQAEASSTPAEATAMTEPSVIPTESPTEVPPTPTTTPTPATPSGTLSLAGQYGYGTGQPFYGKKIQLSADEQDLIVTTSAGIFTFSAEDLSPKLAIHKPGNIWISRDSTQAVAVSYSSMGELILKVWDLASGDLLDEYTIPLDETTEFRSAMEIAISPDNQQAALLDDQGMILVINLSDGTVVKRIEDYVNNTSTPLWLEFDPTGKSAYYVFRDVSSMGIQSAGLNTTSWQEASLHDTLVIPYFPWTIGVFSPQLSSSGYKFGYFTGGKTVAAMDYSTLATRFEIRRTDPISAFAFSPDGSKVAMAGTEPTQLEVWKVDTIKAPEQTFRIPNKLWSVAVTSNGESSFGIDDKGTLYKWQSGQSEPVISRKGFWPVGTGLEFTEDGQTLRLFTNNYTTLNNEVFEFQPKSGDLKGIFPNPYVLDEMKDEYPQSIALSPDKTLMAVVYSPYVDKNIRLFDYTTGKFIRKIPSKIGFDTIDFTPDGKSLIGYGWPDNPVQVIDINSGKVVEKFPVTAEFENGVDEMRLSGDKATMVLSGRDGLLKAYKTDTFELIQAMDESVPAYWFAISNDGSRVAYLTWDGKLGLWDIPSNTLFPEYELSGYPDLTMTSSFPQLAFSPDNLLLALSMPDGMIRVFNIAP